MKNKIAALLIGLVVSFSTRAQVIEVVDSKDVPSYAGKSYQFLTEVKLKPTFYFVGTSNSSFTIQACPILNQPATIRKNFIRTETLLDRYTSENSISALPIDKKSITFSYFDGLGRPTQDVSAQSSPGMRDVIKPHVYDGFSRQVNDYLPYSITNQKGGFRDNIDPEVKAFFSNTPNVSSDLEPYTVNKFDDSPLNQVRKAYGVGKDWHETASNRPVQSMTLINVDNEVMQWIYNGPNPPSLSTPNPPSLSGYVPGKTLTVTQTIDEQGQIRKTYTNFKGQVLLSRVGDGATWFDTYNVYDWSGNVGCIVPPEASLRLATASNYASASVSTKQAFLIDWCFMYEYDNFGRVKAKKIPGASWIYQVFDPWDRLVMSWDGTKNASQQQQWLFTKYDQLNRPIVTGFYYVANGTDPDVTQGNVDSYYNSYNTRYETRQNNATGYSINATFPVLSDDSNLLTVTYYDDYAFRTYSGSGTQGSTFNYVAENGLPSTNFTTPTGQILGQVTGSKTRLLGTTTWLNSVSYYNNQYRQIQTISGNHLSGIDRVSDDIDFTGRKKKTLRAHTATVPQLAGSTTSSQFSALEEYFYDHVGRPTQTWQTLDPGTGTRTLVSSNSYNEKGELIEKNLHSVNNGSTFLQSVDYRYNIRGALTSINNSSLSNDGVLNNDANDVFGMELLYNTSLSITGGTTPLFNGNISAIKWKSTNLNDQPKERAFAFTYDVMNRLGASNYATNNSGTFSGDAGMFNSSYSYDRNGNIINLSRYGMLGGGQQQIDNLGYNYTGNKLNYVNDGSTYAQFGSKGQGFTEKSNMAGAEFQYDPAGNAKQDLNRGIDVTYNHVNRPTRVDFGANNYILYTYDAGGSKLGEKVYVNGTLTTERHYVGGIHYENGALAFVQVDEGRALKSNGNWTYEYHLKDHQGNVMAAIGNLKEAYAYRAGMEPNDATAEGTFKNLTHRSGDYNHSKPTVTSPVPVKSIITNGASAGSEMGPGIKLPAAINQGDHINMSVYAKYVSGGSNYDVLGSLLTLATTALGVSTSEAAYTGFTNHYPNAVSTVAANSSCPKAYLNYILFNSTFTSKQFGYQPVASTVAGVFEKLEIDITIPSGFDGGSIYIFTTNESDYTTYFDDMFVLHEKSNATLQVTQLSDYYPFGVGFNVWNKETLSANRYTYQGQENQDDLDYNEYFYKFRMHDPTMGRFLSVDPLSEQYSYNSPYAFSGNRVIDAVELEGKEPELVFGPQFMTELDWRAQANDDNYAWGAIDMANSRMEAFGRWVGSGFGLVPDFQNMYDGYKGQIANKIASNDEDYQKIVPFETRQITYNVNDWNARAQMYKGQLGILNKSLNAIDFVSGSAFGSLSSQLYKPDFNRFNGVLKPVSKGDFMQVPQEVNRIYSARELMRRAEETGPFHNFPDSYDRIIFSDGSKIVSPDFFKNARPGLSNTNILYQMSGTINGNTGIFEIGVRPSLSGNTELIMHRFFNPTR